MAGVGAPYSHWLITPMLPILLCIKYKHFVTLHIIIIYFMAGEQGLEPRHLVLETNMLPITSLPLVAWVGNDPTYADFQSAANPSQLPSHNR